MGGARLPLLVTLSRGVRLRAALGLANPNPNPNPNPDPNQACSHRDTGLACRAPDAQNCAGCETGELAGSTPTEHCCGADSCAHCNRTGRCTPADASRGDPREQVRDATCDLLLSTPCTCSLLTLHLAYPCTC